MLDLKALSDKIDEFEKIIDYNFKDKKKLVLALTHSSYANECKNEKLASNERLEFLGDAVLEMVVSEHIYLNSTYYSEGEMTKFRANVVCERSLEKCAKSISIGNYLLLGKGEENSGGRKRTSILSDAVEALIGAIYLDGGFESAKAFILNQLGELINKSINGSIFTDYKTQLQEYIQKTSDHTISYEIIEEIGPDHSKMFVSQVKIDEKTLGIGKGRSKKEAEQMAAKAYLEKIKA
ncbi:MAG TPA: ribonuclease III [Acetivibrio sp.]|jgi:ribonuclease-3|nr:ribonuclease III [Clostridium sp.]HOQ37341.1 ribonuclease III [Acetivibrio sp.]HPT91669.1 ribonuclease III [Acetivibrio sp.]HQA57780.1 ribonuclease III [Acetivibrio sp.]